MSPNIVTTTGEWVFTAGAASARGLITLCQRGGLEDSPSQNTARLRHCPPRNGCRRESLKLTERPDVINKGGPLIPNRIYPLPKFVEGESSLEAGVLNTRIDDCSNSSLDGPTEDFAFTRYMFMGRGSIIESVGRSFFLHSSPVIRRRKENTSIFHDDVHRPAFSRRLFGIDFPRSAVSPHHPLVEKLSAPDDTAVFRRPASAGDRRGTVDA